MRAAEPSFSEELGADQSQVSCDHKCPRWVRQASVLVLIYRGSVTPTCRSADTHTQPDTDEVYGESPTRGSLDRRRREEGIAMKKTPALVEVPNIESQWLRWVTQDERE